MHALVNSSATEDVIIMVGRVWKWSYSYSIHSLVQNYVGLAVPLSHTITHYMQKCCLVVIMYQLTLFYCCPGMH